MICKHIYNFKSISTKNIQSAKPIYTYIIIHTKNKPDIHDANTKQGNQRVCENMTNTYVQTRPCTICMC